MPELPEVETIRRDLKEKILNKTIVKIHINLSKTVKSDQTQFTKLLKNNQIRDIGRRGKLMIFQLKNPDPQNNRHLLCHLRMTGQLIYQFNCDKDKCQTLAGGHGWPLINKLPNKYSHIILEFADHSHLYFNDQRQFGYMKIVSDKELEKELEKFGIEPLTPDFILQNFANIFSKRKKSIKAVLLDQSLIAGLGNIYADEVCFVAGVLPDRPTNSLTRGKVKKLFEVVNRIIELAISERGTTFSDFVDVDGRSGNFINLVKVYGREGEKCLKCGGKIKKMRVAGRGTHFCEKCQK